MYKTIKDLPSQLDKLPKHAKLIYLKAFNASYEKYGEDSARKIAWSAVKKVYNKDKDGNWIEKKSEIISPVELSMYITKASYVGDRMIFSATASDILPDLYNDEMSLDLYNSFIKNLDGSEYISLAHYPRFDNLEQMNEVGKIEKVYSDGNKLKIKGYFHDTKLGQAAFRAIRKDRRENPIDNRIRMSIGFLDRSHTHKTNGMTWKSESGEFCKECAMGNRNQKLYLDGKLIHSALTRVPVNKRADIDYVKKENQL